MEVGLGFQDAGFVLTVGVSESFSGRSRGSRSSYTRPQKETLYLLVAAEIDLGKVLAGSRLEEKYER